MDQFLPPREPRVFGDDRDCNRRGRRHAAIVVHRADVGADSVGVVHFERHLGIDLSWRNIDQRRSHSIDVQLHATQDGGVVSIRIGSRRGGRIGQIGAGDGNQRSRGDLGRIAAAASWRPKQWL